jgi:hypothetical protein
MLIIKNQLEVYLKKENSRAEAELVLTVIWVVWTRRLYPLIFREKF